MAVWRFLLTLILPALVPVAAAAGVDFDWKPVEPADLALARSAIEPTADAEAIFWEVYVEDHDTAAGPRTILHHYVRVKVFNERGVAAQATVNIPYRSGTHVGGVKGRTIKPDGTIVPLKDDAEFDRVTVRTSGVKIRNKSFVMPAVEPGAILEYRYRETREDALAHYIRLYFQRDIPVQTVTYHIKPLNAPGWVMRSRTFHGLASPFVRRPDGFHSTTARNRPAFREEPHMPPDDQVRMWMLVYYTRAGEVVPDEFWADYARTVERENNAGMKVTGAIRAAAREATAGVSEAREKLRRLYDWCRARIRNRDDAAVAMTEEERDRLKANKSPSEALERGVGSGRDINLVFAAMCRAEEFEAYLARLADRSDVRFDPAFADGYFLQAHDIAVRLREGWILLDPGTPWAPFGRLRWQEEGVKALVCSAGQPTWVDTPIAGPDYSRAERRGTFILDADGNLEGDVEIGYHGHWGAIKRNEWLTEVPEKREQALREAVVGNLGGAEVTAVAFENGADHEKPFGVRYHVRVPGFAQRAGQRLLLQPAFFQRGAKPAFPASARVHPIDFSYPWTTLDTVSIALPEGWEIESGDSPAPAGVEGVAVYDAAVGVSGDGRRLVWTRGFEFGRGGAIYFPREDYRPLKAFFDMVAARDEHALTLRPARSGAR